MRPRPFTRKAQRHAWSQPRHALRAVDWTRPQVHAEDGAGKANSLSESAAAMADGFLPVFSIEAIGAVAAVLTTLCCIPQAARVIRTRETRAISLTTQVALTCGVVLWLVYGIFIGSWPLIGSNAITLVLLSVILTMKLRYG